MLTKNCAEDKVMAIQRHKIPILWHCKNNKREKIYPFDPIISTVLLTYHPYLKVEDSALIEAVAGSHLLRKSRFVSSGLSSISDLFYWQSKAGKEIDFVFLDQDG